MQNVSRRVFLCLLNCLILFSIRSKTRACMLCVCVYAFLSPPPQTPIKVDLVVDHVAIHSRGADANSAVESASLAQQRPHALGDGAVHLVKVWQIGVGLFTIVWLLLPCHILASMAANNFSYAVLVRVCLHAYALKYGLSFLRSMCCCVSAVVSE